MSKKLDLAAIPSRIGSGYPAPFDAPCQRRERKPWDIDMLVRPHTDEYVHRDGTPYKTPAQ